MSDEIPTPGATSELDRRLEREVAEKGLGPAVRDNLDDLLVRFRDPEDDERSDGQRMAAWARHDAEAGPALAELSGTEQERLHRAETGQEIDDPNSSLRRADAVRGRAAALVEASPEIAPELVEADGQRIKTYHEREFENWGQTVENRPTLTCVPKTRIGVCNIVKWATHQGKTVRAAGYRHTWGDFYSADDQVLISLLPLDVVEDLPHEEPEPDPENELQGIEMVGEIGSGADRKGLCRIGAATTNEMFREWVVADGKGHWKPWTLPLNVIMVEITFGGSNGPICHGAGRHTQTLSDLVHEIEFVNANGEIQTVSDPELLKTAAGCFGLLGVVVSLTLKLDPLSYARMHPTTPRLALTIPPPDDFVVPDEIDMEGVTEAKKKAAWDLFVDHCENYYYSEWFWFVFQDECWVNSWQNDGSGDQAEDYPSEARTKLQEIMEFLAHLANKTIFRLLPGRAQAKLMASSAMDALPKGETIVTPLINGLHFQRGIQNMRVYDMEFEIPIPGRADDPSQPDWTVCQKAWWDVIRCVYNRSDTPMRLTMEMRITGDSKIHMAPQHGNQHGTCSIEVLTPANVPRLEWMSFLQEVCDEWDSHSDAEGNPLNARPHWAKEWQGLTMRGRPILEHLKHEAYKDQIPKFKAGLENIAAEGGYGLAEIRARFANPLLEEIFEDVFS
jgi:hypothetical protein